MCLLVTTAICAIIFSSHHIGQSREPIKLSAVKSHCMKCAHNVNTELNGNNVTKKDFHNVYTNVLVP